MLGHSAVDTGHWWTWTFSKILHVFRFLAVIIEFSTNLFKSSLRLVRGLPLLRLSSRPSLFQSGYVINSSSFCDGFIGYSVFFHFGPFDSLQSFLIMSVFLLHMLLPVRRIVHTVFSSDKLAQPRLLLHCVLLRLTVFSDLCLGSELFVHISLSYLGFEYPDISWNLQYF